MKKQVEAKIKVLVPAGKADPSPPIGPALSQRGVNLMEFCKAFNERTAGMEAGVKRSVDITVYADKSFEFTVHSPPASFLLRRALGLDKGSATPNSQKVGAISRSQLEEIAALKQADLTAADMDSAVRSIAGTARSMGIKVEGSNDG